jgi:NAD(P)-dependent dehydrogenase (short-subunit alcohol dehydrogenase family)
MRIAGRTALVTGAAAGTGRVIAQRLEALGAHVATADLADGLDVTDDAQLERLIAGTRPAILVNNAGGGGHVPPHFPDASAAQWGATLDLNLCAPMLATQAALAPMRRSGGGAVVNVASTAGLGSDRYRSPEYGAAKAGLIRFTTALAAVDGVRVNCVVPDWVATERVTAEERATTPPPIPLSAVADAVIELIRDDALAGRVLVLDRGAPPRLE